MEIYQIRVFLEVARHLSFTDAADVLHLTQPAVSAKIKSLETELNTPLFYRLGKKVELTEVGRFLLEEGPKLIQLENQLLQTINEIKKGKVSHLKIGCTTALAEGWLPDILFKFRKQYPEIQTRCVVFESVEFLYRAMTDNQIDVGIGDLSFEGFSEISTTSIGPIHYSAFVAATNPLAKQSWLKIEDLTNHPWVVLPSGFSSRLVFESRLEELGLSLEDFPHLETVDTFSVMRTYLNQGDYIGFACEFAFKLDCQARMLASIPLQEFALPGNVYLLSPKPLEVLNETSLNTRRSHDLNSAQKFIALVQNSTINASNSTSSGRLRSPSFLLHHSTKEKPKTLTLSLGIQNRTIPAIAAGLIIQRLSLLEHFLPKDGRYNAIKYQIQWNNFATGAPIVEGLHAGTLDIGILGDYPLLLSAVQPKDAQKTRLVSFVSANPDSSCNSIIVPNRSNLESIEDLRGRVIAVPFNSSAHSMVMRSLQSVNLLGDVQLISLEHPKSDRAFEFPPHLADGYAHFAPFHDVACRQGNFRYLTNHFFENLPVFYGVVVRAELAERYPEVVIGYLKALTAAQSWYEQTPAALSLVSQWTQLEPEIISRILSRSDGQRPNGYFFSETSIRPDWLNLHIQQLSQIPGNEFLKTIDLNNWVQPEFIQQNRF